MVGFASLHPPYTLREDSERHLVEGKKVRFVLYLEDGRPKYELKLDG